MASNGVPVVIAGTGTDRPIIENSDARLAVLQRPMGVATDSLANLCIAEERLARVRSVSWTGLIKTVAGGGLPTGLSVGDGGLATDARLVDPVAVAWDPVAGLRVVEYFGNRVRGLFASGKIFTVAGDGEPGYRGDSAPASQARLNRPAPPSSTARATSISPTVSTTGSGRSARTGSSPPSLVRACAGSTATAVWRRRLS